MKRLIIFVLFFFSCSSDEGTTYTKYDITSKVFAHDSSARVIVEDQKISVDCSLYGEGCLNVYRGMVMNYEVFFVEFDTEKHSYFEAKKRKTLYAGNWLFDNIQGEQILLKFFTQYLNAKSGSTNKASL